MPGAADFAIRLTAEDAFSPVLARADRAVADLHRAAGAGVDPRPGLAALAQFEKAAHGAASGIGRSFGPSLFRPLVDGFGEARRHAREMVREVGDLGRHLGDGLRRAGAILPPLSGLSGAATIAGVVGLTDRFASTGAGIRRSAAGIGISPRDLQRWTGAGEYAGLAPAETTGALAAITSHLHEAAYGRDLLAFNALTDPRLGLGGVRNPDGSIRSAASFMPVLARAIGNQKDPHVQREILSVFGAEAMLPLLQQGMPTIEQHMGAAESRGGVLNDDQLERAHKLEEAWIGLGQAARGAGISIATQLAPRLEHLADWLSKPANVKFIGDKIEHFLGWLEHLDLSKIDRILDKIDGIMRGLGLTSTQEGGSWPTGRELAVGGGGIGLAWLFGGRYARGLIRGAVRGIGAVSRPIASGLASGLSWLLGTAAAPFAIGMGLGAAAISGPQSAEWANRINRQHADWWHSHGMRTPEELIGGGLHWLGHHLGITQAEAATTGVGAAIRGSANFAKRSGLLGDPRSPGWAPANLVTIVGPTGASFRVHRLAAPAFQGFLQDLDKAGYPVRPDQSFGYALRNIRGGSQLSEHAYGNAIDVNSLANPMGSPLRTNLPANVGEMAARWGLTWGGDWKSRPDPMHFEWTGAPIPSAGGAAPGEGADSHHEVEINLGTAPRRGVPDWDKDAWTGPPPLGVGTTMTGP